MKKAFSILSLTIILTSSCKKDEDSEQNPMPIQPSTQYNYLQESIYPYKFKTGTYWVYENDSTAVLDSVVVDSISTGFFESIPSVHGTTGNTMTEFYKIFFHHYGTMQLYNQSLMNNYMVRNYSGNWSNFLGQPVYATNSPIGTSFNGMTITSKFLSMNVNLNTFNYVDEIKITASAQSLPEFLYDTYLYYCDSVGLIKKETEIIPGNIESWSLKRWNIIR